MLWPFTGYGEEGTPLIDRMNPVELQVRWVGKQSEALDPLGNTIAIDATAITNTDIVIGSRMWLGTLSDWLGTGSGSIPDEAMIVKTFNKTSDLKNRFVQRSAGLMRYTDDVGPSST